jgi:hypothetical protein
MSFIHQVLTMLNTSFIRKFRAPTIYLELALPAMFFIFVCLFANRIKLWTGPSPAPEEDQYLPFAKVPGPAPQDGLIANNDCTHLLMGVVDEVPLPFDLQNQVAAVTRYFETYEDYKSWVEQNRESATLSLHLIGRIRFHRISTIRKSGSRQTASLVIPSPISFVQSLPRSSHSGIKCLRLSP